MIHIDLGTFDSALLWRSEDNLWQSVLSTFVPGSQTQIVKLGASTFPCFNHLTRPGFWVFPFV